MAVNRCDVKWPLIYPWNARGDRGFGDAWKLFHGEIRGPAARVRSAVAYSKRRPANLNLEIQEHVRGAGITCTGGRKTKIGGGGTPRHNSSRPRCMK